MERKLLFTLSAATDTEFSAALLELRNRQQQGWRLFDLSERDEPGGQHVGAFEITDGDFNRRLLFELSPPTIPEFHGALDRLRALQAQQWGVFDADREVEAGSAVGVIKIKHA